MVFPQSLAPKQLQSYQSTIALSIDVRSRFEMMAWLRGDMQQYLPHDILIAAWGGLDFSDCRHDVMSAVTGTCLAALNTSVIHLFLCELHSRWDRFGRRPYSGKSTIGGFLADVGSTSCPVVNALQCMRSVMVHGVTDRRAGACVLYAAFSRGSYDEGHRAALALAVPYIDVALRQLDDKSQRLAKSSEDAAPDTSSSTLRAARNRPLSGREVEVLHWVGLGKTNAEIGLILGISEFTVKNHLQRLFRKLEVANRAQAVARLRLVNVVPAFNSERLSSGSGVWLRSIV